jgi:predicted nucleic acid-binding protein
MKLFDTSVLIEQLQRRFFERGAISAITLIEVLRGVPQEKSIKVKNLMRKRMMC